MSKQLFELMRAEEMATLYDSTFTKREAVATGKNLVIKTLNDGEIDSLVLWANLSRLSEVVNSAVSELRSRVELFEKTTIFGVEFNPVNGSNTVNYAEDEIWSKIKADLEARTEQLKLAQKQDTFDAYGNQVPKVSTTPRKSSITLKF